MARNSGRTAFAATIGTGEPLLRLPALYSPKKPALLE